MLYFFRINKACTLLIKLFVSFCIHELVSFSSFNLYIPITNGPDNILRYYVHETITQVYDLYIHLHITITHMKMLFGALNRNNAPGVEIDASVKFNFRPVLCLISGLPQNGNSFRPIGELFIIFALETTDKHLLKLPREHLLTFNRLKFNNTLSNEFIYTLHRIRRIVYTYYLDRSLYGLYYFLYT